MAVKHSMLAGDHQSVLSFYSLQMDISSGVVAQSANQCIVNELESK